MNDGLSGLEPGDAGQPEASGVAERLIRDEFSEAAPAHRSWFHREVREATPPQAVDDNEVGSVTHPTMELPIVGADGASDETLVAVAPIIHEEFIEPARAARSRSHRTGMLAGLGVVGILLAVLVLLAPGGSKPRLPAQSVHDVSPIAASGPRTEAATTPSTAAPSTTSSAPGASTPTTQPHQSETVSTTITYVYLPGTPTPTPTPTPDSAPTTTPTTAAPATTTTLPPTTTTTARHCLLGIIC